MKSIIEIKNVSFRYDDESGEVLHDLSLSVREGEFLCVLGHNGCGKSTLAKLINGLYQPTAGTVTVDGMDLTDARLEPAFSAYSKTVYYTVHPDVTYLLSPGKNTIGIQVAEGWRNNHTDLTRSVLESRSLSFMGRSQLWAMLVLHYGDGRTETIATDEDWCVKFGPVVNASIFNGETYDARLADRGWDSASSSPTGFVSAVEVPAPGGVMRPMALEPIRQTAEYPAIEITTPKPGVFVADFGQNVAGWCGWYCRKI